MPDLAVLRGFPPCRNRGDPYIVHCNTAIGVAVLLPFLGVSSLNFGPLATAAFFLGPVSAPDSRLAIPVAGV